MSSVENFRDNSDGCSGSIWSPTSNSWLCGDSLGLLYSYDTSEPEIKFNSHDINLTNPITCIAAHPSEAKIAVGCGDSVYLKGYPDQDVSERLTRRTLPITHLQFTQDGFFLFISSREPDIVVYNINERKVESTITTSSVGVRYFSVSPDGSYLAIMDENGSMTIQSIVENSVRRMETIAAALVSKQCARDYFNSGYSFAWFEAETESSTPRLLVPSNGGSLLLFTGRREVKADWEEKFLIGDTINGVAHDESTDVMLVSVSPNGKFLATADVAGCIVIWKVDTDHPDSSVALKKIDSLKRPLISLSWGQESGDNYLLALSADGAYRLNAIIDSGHGKPVAAGKKVIHAEPISSDAFTPFEPTADVNNDLDNELSDEQMLAAAASFDLLEASQPTTVAPQRKRLTKGKDDSAKENDDDDSGLFTASKPASTETAADEPPPRRTVTFSAKDVPVMPSNRRSLLDDEADVDHSAAAAGDDDDDDNSDDRMLEEEDDDADDADSFIINDGDAPINSSMKPEDMLALARTLRESAAVKVKLQTAFSPASSRPDDKNRRYLVWNSIGNITLREDALESRVEIRFTDASAGNRNEAFADRIGIKIGALGQCGAVFASEAEKPVENPDVDFAEKSGSVVFYHAFAGAQGLEGVNEDFRVTLSDSEDVLALAVGLGFVALATSKGLLRIFNSTGVETSVTWLRGPVVCMAACNATLAIVYHAEHPLEETFRMNIDVLQIDWRRGCRGTEKVSALAVPLTRKASLEWIGFDVDSELVVLLDSEGQLSCLAHDLGWRWIPVLNIPQVRKAIDHKYWPITVRTNKLVYVLLNGESKPAVYPQPVVSTRQLRVAIATNKDGSNFNEAQKEKSHQLLWETTKSNHYEFLLSQASSKAGGNLEESSRLEELLEQQQMVADKLVLKSFQEACQAQQIPLALSLAVRIRTTKAIEAAIKVANHFGRVRVAEALDSILQHRLALEQLAQQFSSYPSHETAALPGSESAGISYSQRHEELSSSHHHYQQLMDSQGEAQQQGAGVLSRKASLKQSSQQQLPPAPRSKVVSPNGSEDVPSSAAKSLNLNPFAVNKTGSTPVKRKTALDGVEELQNSPSPKKAALNRTSTFSQAARINRQSDKHIL